VKSDYIDPEFRRWLEQLPPGFIRYMYEVYNSLDFRERQQFIFAIRFALTEEPKVWDVKQIDIDAIHRNPRYKAIPEKDIRDFENYIWSGKMKFKKDDKGGK